MGAKLAIVCRYQGFELPLAIATVNCNGEPPNDKLILAISGMESPISLVSARAGHSSISSPERTSRIQYSSFTNSLTPC